MPAKGIRDDTHSTTARSPTSPPRRGLSSHGDGRGTPRGVGGNGGQRQPRGDTRSLVEDSQLGCACSRPRCTSTAPDTHDPRRPPLSLRHPPRKGGDRGTASCERARTECATTCAERICGLRNRGQRMGCERPGAKRPQPTGRDCARPCCSGEGPSRKPAAHQRRQSPLDAGLRRQSTYAQVAAGRSSLRIAVLLSVSLSIGASRSGAGLVVLMPRYEATLNGR